MNLFIFSTLTLKQRKSFPALNSGTTLKNMKKRCFKNVEQIFTRLLGMSAEESNSVVHCSLSECDKRFDNLS